jgi:ribosome biogenesis GTPase / thiamine phosphate phosphatase
MNHEELGWDSHFEGGVEACQSEGLIPARVAREDRQMYAVLCADGELTAEVSGKMRHEAQGKDEFPAVGDWVAIAPRAEEGKATIHVVLPRRSAFSRKVAGGNTEAQVVAANVDTVFLVSGLDGDFNTRRIERYLTVAWDSGANPVVVLNKADLCEDVAARMEDVEAVAFGVPIHAVSALDNTDIDALRSYLGSGKTVAFLGSSGVGKSTLVNSLIGAERQATGAVRDDDSRGRHTTTRRELIVCPGGGVLIDTPGMRELQLWADEEGLKRTFDDVEELAARCRFGDCSHQSEPGCAIQEALADGTLDAARYGSYTKLQRELQHLERKQSHRAAQIEKDKWKKIKVQYRQHTKMRDKL